ncbi:UDP-N-acetylglucosamine 2-epimerase (non-hydrolyzing) [bacterium]|nr:UDP-N-acetylglucosamine 2-epimerase (non-hydrolyzing) [bacterium]
MKKIKVMTVVGTRPEIIRLSSIIKKLDQYFDHHLIDTGQNYDYELNEIFYDDLGLGKPFEHLGCAGKTAVETIANIMVGVEKIIKKVKPEAFIILGDTNSCLSAYVAKRYKIPIFHFEAGNRCFDYNVPEEINRKIVDSVADVNITYSQIARSYLVNEGFPPQNVICIGSPMKEVINDNIGKINNSTILSKHELQKNKYFVLSCHREENVDSQSNLEQLAKILRVISEKYDLPIIFSAHPRTIKNVKKYGIEFVENVRMLRPVSFSDYNCLQVNSFCTLSDSGTITEESSILGFSAINLRENQERPEGLEVGVCPFTGFNENAIMTSLALFENRSIEGPKVLDYEAKDVSDRFVKLLVSYIPFINKYTWHR